MNKYCCESCFTCPIILESRIDHENCSSQAKISQESVEIKRIIFTILLIDSSLGKILKRI